MPDTPAAPAPDSSPGPGPDLSSLISTLVTDDPAFRAHVQSRLEELVDETFDIVLDILHDGDTTSRVAVAKQVLPVFLKVRKDSEDLDTEATAAMHAEVRDMIAGMGAEQPGATPLAPVPPVEILVDEAADGTLRVDIAEVIHDA